VRLLGPETEEFRLPSENMVPTLPAGTTVTLNRDAYASADPALGDIVILHPPRGAETSQCGAGAPPPGTMCERPTARRLDVTLIQRVAGLPGDELTMREGRIVRDGKPLDEPYAARCAMPEGCDFPQPISVPAGHYFVLGDNRGASDDSRFWGPVPRDWILGRVEDCDLLRMSCTPVR
jgi:signal peptidase I